MFSDLAGAVEEVSGARWRRLDVSGDGEVALLTEVLRAGSEIEDPARLNAHFGAWYGRQRKYERYVSVSRRGLGEGEYKITRMRSSEELKAVGVEPANPWRDWASLPTHRGGFIGAVLEVEEPQIFVELDLRDDPVLGPTMGEMRSCLAVPNYDGGKALNWAMFFSSDPAGWTVEEMRQAVLDSNLLGSATRNLVARREVAALNARLRSQLEQIASIQQSLLPHRLPVIPGLELATSYFTSDQAGGDYYDFLEFPPDSEGRKRWGIVIADVAGHGAGAATVMAMLRAILHCFEGGGDPSPADVLEYTNRKLYDSNLTGSFATAFFAVYEPESGELRWARAGHNPPRLKRGGDGTVLALDGEGGLPLGVVRESRPSEERLVLGAGDTLVLYTDGITEAFNAEREQFGPERFDEALGHCSGAPECVVDSIHCALFRHTGRMSRDDDQTLVVLRRRGGEECARTVDDACAKAAAGGAPRPAWRKGMSRLGLGKGGWGGRGGWGGGGGVVAVG